MKQILCFGDSNTWGLIPATRKRYPWGVRWTSILQEKTKKDDVRIIEEGLCGRTTVFEDELRTGRKGTAVLPMILESHSPLDEVIIMLGTNDCKRAYNASAEVIGKGAELLISQVKAIQPQSKILLVSTIDLGDEVWKSEFDPEFSKESVAVSKQLKNVYEKVAEKENVYFLAASDFAKSSKKDMEHLSHEGHAALAEAIYKKQKEMNII